MATRGDLFQKGVNSVVGCFFFNFRDRRSTRHPGATLLPPGNLSRQSGNTFHKRGFCRQIPASGKSHQGSDIRNGGGKEMQRKVQKRLMPNVREDVWWSSYQIFHFMQYFSPVAVERSGFGSTLVNWGQIWSH